MNDLSLDALEQDLRKYLNEGFSTVEIECETVLSVLALIAAARTKSLAVAESEIPEILSRAGRGEALSPPEQAAHTGYEIGWRDGRNDALSRPVGWWAGVLSKRIRATTKTCGRSVRRLTRQRRSRLGSCMTDGCIMPGLRKS